MQTPNKTARARHLRKNLTDAEQGLWNILRNRQVLGYRFRRQAPIGPYIVDFVCFENRLVIEVDGRQHMERADYDAERTAWLESAGFRVKRFWNNQVLQEKDAVREAIFLAVRGSSPPILAFPRQGGRDFAASGGEFAPFLVKGEGILLRQAGSSRLCSAMRNFSFLLGFTDGSGLNRSL